ncbi:MAG TPA: bacteriohopanetetrol glucosamine biosynthesis glycosyltransferase HpnI [Terriglobia bacterium]|nr:bacteriohopanetetrol glucosamine biosynthesis glycosyltransferase HpnI [Terriglobia bacterium]
MVWIWLRWAVLGGAILPSLSYLFIIFAARSFFRQQRKAPTGFTPPVSVLKPVFGLDPEAYENFASFCRLDYPEYEILFGVADERDAATPVIRKVIADFPSIAIRLIMAPEKIGSNNKVNKLCGLARAARHGLLVVSDADIRVGPGYLRSVAAPFRGRKVGAVTSLYTGIPLPSLWPELEAIYLSTEFMPAILMARQLEGVSFGLGATVAIRRECLEEMGGFEALADEAADDHELGRRTRARGHRVELVDATVKTWCSLTTWREFYLQRLRWTIMTRQARPLGFVGYIFTQGLPLTALALFFAPTRLLAAGLLAASLILRMAAAWTMGVWGLKDDVVKRRWWLVPVWDALAFVLWANSLVWSRVRWRGVEYRVAGGRLIPVAPRS